MRVSLFTFLFLSMVAVAAPKKATAPKAKAPAAKAKAVEAAKPAEAPVAAATVPAETPVAAPVTTAPTTLSTEATVAPATDMSLIADIYLRPSYLPETGEYYTENSAELGIRPNADQTFLYHQDFNTNLLSRSELQTGVGLKAYDGYFKAVQNNIWKSGDWSFGYAGRIYLPTRSEKRDAGMITAVRNYANLGYRLSSTAGLTLSEIPIVHVYDRSGFGTAANPAFENRVYLTADWSITDKVTFYFPLNINSTRYRDFAGAANSGTWDHFVWINPEIYYTFNTTYDLGLGYYNNTGLMSSDLSSFQIGDGLKDGVVQMILKASL